MNDIFSTQNLVQTGAVIIALVLVYLNYKLVSNHLEHNTVATQKLTDVIEELTAFLKNKLK